LEARELIDHQVAVIGRDWPEICDLAHMTTVDRAFFWGRQLLNPYAFEGYSAAPV
jgi:serine/threonine-protein kinase HipA